MQCSRDNTCRQCNKQGYKKGCYYPITVYLHFDIDRFDGDLADLEIKYQDPNTNQWKTDGIKNVRILGNKIAFDVEHLTLFGIFASRPTGLTAMPGENNDAINLTWEDNSDSETGIEVYRKAEDDPNFMLLEFTDPNINTYSDTNCVCDKTYLYKIRAISSFGPSEYSNESSAAVPCSFISTTEPPEAPSDLTVAASSLNNTSISWQDNSDNELGFRIFRKGLGDSDFKLIGTTGENITTYIDTDLLDKNKEYEYAVAAYNSAGDSEYSNKIEYSTEYPTDDTITDAAAQQQCFIFAIGCSIESTFIWCRQYILSIRKWLR